MKWYETSKIYNISLAITIGLVAANAVMFLLCLRDSGGPMIPANVLIMKGALTASSAQPGQYWRLIAYGFLHTNAIQLGMNVLSLLICGPFLERRLGPSTFLVVYVATLIGGGLTSVFAHPSPFVTVGTSGGIFGIVGALFALWILGANELSPSFFFMNFTMNFVFAARNPNLDLGVHIGGFVTGMVCIALLDLITHCNIYWFRCKFPEFVKFNVLILAALGGLHLYLFSPEILASLGNPMINLAAWLLVFIFAIKITDMLLAIRHGLIGVVLAFAVLNSLLSYIFCGNLYNLFDSYCYKGSYRADGLNEIIRTVCVDPTAIKYAVTSCVFVLTLLFYIYPLQRGFRDVGFVGATFRAERRRQRIRGAI